MICGSKKESDKCMLKYMLSNSKVGSNLFILLYMEEYLEVI